jgi:hypothetical protein
LLKEEKKKIMLPLHSLLCVGGCGFNETINHLFFECDIFSSLWRMIASWLGVSDLSSIDVYIMLCKI